MVQDSEKRFHQIMDKFFSSPLKSTPVSSSSSPGEQQSSGKKCPNPSSALSLVEPNTGSDVIGKCQHLLAPARSSEAPLCRPWDRGGLMRRLATFKSMTWFAKPQVISAVNCARRGWVNVDMDTIACESCGARLLFSTPSSWPKQQVEKATSVFSLKLDKGHKLLCPWIDNSCDEMLAEFPPMTPQVLVDKFRERSSALLQLFDLPVISTSAIENMRSPELEEFLKQPVMPECSNVTAEFSQLESLGNEHEATSATLYCQAQKLISLCGWEPRSLHYVVDWKENLAEFVRDSKTVILSHGVASGKLLSSSTHSADKNEILEANEKSRAHDDLQSDPKSVVLDCKLCGASAGLWVFSTVPRPLELCRVVGYTEVNTEKRSDAHDLGSGIHHANSAKQSSNLNLTIAGGPPATKQNIKATISLPVIGRNLRAKFVSNKGHSLYSNQKDSDLYKIVSGNELVAQSENMDLLENGKDDSVADHRHKIFENGGTIAMDSKNLISPGTANATEESSVSGKNGSNVQENIGVQLNDQEFTIDRLKGPGNNRGKGSTTGKDMNQSSSSKEMEFDPIRQHRHFCPWIASTGRREPGWRQTLCALQRQRESSHPSPSPIKVDDPISSVRNLFESPSTKRAKPRRGSS